MVSNISSGAGSVGVAKRPALPNTLATSGNDFSTRSIRWMTSPALASLMPGTAVGMYSSVPSFSGGMNSLPRPARQRDRDRHQQPRRR